MTRDGIGFSVKLTIPSIVLPHEQLRMSRKGISNLRRLYRKLKAIIKYL